MTKRLRIENHFSLPGKPLDPPSTGRMIFRGGRLSIPRQLYPAHARSRTGPSTDTGPQCGSALAQPLGHLAERQISSGLAVRLRSLTPTPSHLFQLTVVFAWAVSFHSPICCSPWTGSRPTHDFRF